MYMIIHIGKCGGSNIVKKFRENHNLYVININHLNDYKKKIPNKIKNGKYIISYHCGSQKNKKLTNLLKDNNIAILIRDPITRFISIFFHYYRSYTKGVLDKSYYYIYERFKTPNQLAEALNSENLNDKKIALSAFRVITHLRYDFNYYLGKDRINYIHNNNNKVFIIRQEYYKNDFKLYYDYIIKKLNLENRFDKFFSDIKNNTDEYKNLKNLSEKAISNLKKKMISDYIILDELCKYNFISKEYLNSLT